MLFFGILAFDNILAMSDLMLSTLFLSPHKLGVIRTLYDRANNIILESEDQKQERCHINNALRGRGYPDWLFKEVKIIVTIPYVSGVSEAVAWTLWRHGIATAVRT